MRVGIYYAPALRDPLWRAGCQWLGRDPETAADTPQPAVPDLHALTANPRLYGFHATLKPPMRLATSYGAFLDDAARLAAALTAFDLPALRVADLKGFLALRESPPSPALQALADRCVAELDSHRAPPSPEELVRRREADLSAAQEAMLLRWGYPHVFGTWFFHMTLTRRLAPAERDLLLPHAERHFAAALAVPRRVDCLTVFTQAAAGAPFLVAERLPFGR